MTKEDELEIERMRLAACGVAALANTEKTKKDRLERNNLYWSASYGSVCDAVDREIKYREALKIIVDGAEGWIKQVAEKALERDSE